MRTGSTQHKTRIMRGVLSICLAVLLSVVGLSVISGVIGNNTLGTKLTAYADTWNGSYGNPGSSQYDASGSTVHLKSAQALAYFVRLANTGTNFSGITVYLDVDVDMNSTNFGDNVLSGGYNDNNRFKGTFDGQNHTIANFKMVSSDHRVAMFRTTENATFRNLNFSGVFIDDASDSNKKNGFGVLVGYHGTGSLTFENVHVNSGNIYGYNYVGALVGEVGANSSGNRLTMTNCSNGATINAINVRIGGLAGSSLPAVYATNCSNTGSVTGGSTDVGGIVGWIEDDPSTFSGCSNSGAIQGTDSVGGILGYFGNNSQDQKLTLTNNTNTGNITSNNRAAGICALIDTDNNAHSISGNTNRGTINAGSDGGGIVARNKGFGVWENNRNYGSVRGGNDNAGGICGEVEDDKQVFSNCYNSGAITGQNTTGGIAGWLDTAHENTFTRCANSGTITSNGGYAAGVLGGGKKESRFTECYNVGTISGQGDSGGLAGHVEYHTFWNRCFNVGNVTSPSNKSAGGLIGYTSYYGADTNQRMVDDCFNWATITAGTAGGLVGYVDSNKPYKVEYSYNTGTVNGSQNSWAFVGYGGNCGTQCFKTWNVGSGTYKTEQEMIDYNFSIDGYFCKNTWGVKVNNTTYYFPILTWYRNLFTFNSTFVDGTSNMNTTVSKLYNNSFNTPTISGATGVWANDANWNASFAQGASINPGVTSPTNTYVITQETNNVESIHNDTTYHLHRTMTLNVEENPYIRTGGDCMYYRFTPSESGNYIFFSYKDSYVDSILEVYNVGNSGSYISRNDDYSDSTIYNLLGAERRQSYTGAVSLTAGNTYVVKAFCYSSNTGTYPMKVCKAVNITFNATGGATTFTKVLPAGHHGIRMNQSGLTRGNHSLIAWSLSHGGAQDKTCMAGDTVTIPTVDTTYYALWNPTAPTTAEVNTDYTVSIDSEYQVVYYSFTPSETRKYYIHSTGTGTSPDPYLVLSKASDWQSSAAYIIADDNSDGGSQFAVKNTTLTANTQYLIGVKLSDGGTGSYTFRIEPIYTVTFKAENGTTLKTEEVVYGSSATPPAAQTKAPDATNHYTFIPWSGYTNVTADKTITASFTATAHTVATDAAVPATCMATGISEGKHCSVCNYVITAQTVTPKDMSNHIGELKTRNVNEVAGTCMAEATWTEETYCDQCGTVTASVPKTGEKDMTNHVGELKTRNVNEVAGTCMAEATWTEETYCDQCGTVTASVPKTGAKDMTNHIGELKTRNVNEVAGTCMAEATWTEETYCDQCGTVTASVPKTGEKDMNNHVGEIKTRNVNEVAGTCMAEATWTEETYCDQCGTVTNSENKTGAKDMTNHIGELKTRNVNEVAGTCMAEATWTEETYCNQCGTVTASVPKTGAKDMTNHIGELKTRNVNEVAGTCMAEATWTEETYCDQCGTVTASVPKTGEKDMTNHVGELKTRNVNEVAGTCMAEATWTEETYCDQCGTVTASVPKTGAKDMTNHIGELKTRNVNEVAGTCMAEATWTEETYCDQCGTVTNSENKTGAKDMTNHIGELKTRNVNEVAGTCMAEATWTEETYCDQCGTVTASVPKTGTKDMTNHIGELKTRNVNEVAGTCMAEATWTEETYCDQCGTVTASVPKTGTKDMTNHIGELKTRNVNEVAGTCMAEATWTEETYCDQCGTVTASVPKTGEKDMNNHVGEIKTRNVNVVPGTCMAEATWTEETYCDQCGTVTNSENKTGAKDMTNHIGELKTRNVNEVAGTCMAEATWTEETYCDQCGTVTASVPKTGEKDMTNHIGELKTRNVNEVAGTCMAEATWTEETYCDQCGMVTASVPKTGEKDMTNHIGELKTRNVNEVAGTCMAEATWTEETYCDQCGTVTASVPKTGEKDMTNHIGELKTRNVNEVAGTCMAEATWTEETYCDQCGTVTASVPKTGEKDMNNHVGELKTRNVNVVPGTCMAEATWTEETYCDKCNTVTNTENKTGEKDMANHVGELKTRNVNVVPGTCMAEATWTEETYCDQCNTVTNTENKTGEKDLNNHDLIDHEGKEPTCTEGGWAAYQTCSRCDYTTYAALAPLGHTAGEVAHENEVPATCVSEGSYEAVVTCTKCGIELSRDTVITPLNPNAHDWNDWTVYTAVTCTEDGTEIRFCKLNHDHYEIRNVSAPGHTWGEWITVREATPTEDGLERRVCLVCNETEERVIPFVGEKNRTVQFVVTGSMHYVVHLQGVDYEIYSKQTPAIYWYDGADLTFNVVLHSDCGYSDYTVSLNDKALSQNPDGSYTIPGGTDYVKININPVSTATSDGGSHTSSGGVCKYCGKVHPNNLWGIIVAFFHAIFYFFKHLFG